MSFLKFNYDGFDAELLSLELRYLKLYGHCYQKGDLSNDQARTNLIELISNKIKEG